jgi:ElaB/YqjD/DUF883 family membrane-anchored ribosome-binding protein
MKSTSRSPVESSLIALGAAGIGVGLMYLLDPEQGRRRRAAIISTAEHALAHAGETAGATLHGAKSTVRAMAEKVSDYAHHMAENLNDSAQDVADHADNQVRGYLSQAHQFHHHLVDRAGALVTRAKKAAHLDSDLHPIALTAGITGATVGVLGLGAGLMYVFDPAKGRARRAWMCDKAMSFTRRSGKSARQYGRHLGNRMRGVVAETRRNMPSMPSAPRMR